MKRISLILLSIMVVFVTVTLLLAQKSKTNETMEARWKKVEEFSNKELPESALKEVEIILEQAKKENNSPQIIKAMIYKMRFKTDINPDEALPMLKEFEAYADKSSDLTEKAILYTMTAKLYNDYYQNNRWNIDRRTELEGTVPEDIKEWTKNIFVNKIIQQLNQAMKNPDILKKTSSLKYADILEQGRDSRTIQPTLFDFLSYKKIELLNNFVENNDDISIVDTVAVTENFSEENSSKNDNNINNQILDTYNQLIDFNSEQNNKPATVYAELQKLQFENPNQDENYLDELNKLEKKYAENEAVVEVLVVKAQYFLNKSDEEEEGKNTFRKQAYEICQTGIKRFPNYKRIGLLKNIQNTILQKNIQISNNSSVKPNSELEINIQSTNIEKLQLSVYKVNATALEYMNYKINKNNNKKLYPKVTLLETKIISPKESDNFSAVDTVIKIKSTDYGIYEYVVEEKGNTTAEKQTVNGFTVTDLAFILRGNSKTINSNNRKDKITEIFLLDRASGKPYKDAVLQVYNQKWNGNGYNFDFVSKISSQTEGNYVLPNDETNNNFVIFERGKDKFFTSQTYSYWYGNYEQGQPSTQVSLFTDRSLYRPGQTVYFKGIAYIANKSKQEVAKNQSFTINLYNVNGENIGTKNLVSNDFGSFAGDFVLPENGLNGAYRLQAGNNSVNIWVEEYKRPTFEVKIETPKNEIRFNEEVTMKGNVQAYAGYNINDAAVKYRVARRPHRFCWWVNEPEKIIVTGQTTSDADGNFEIKFTPEKDKNNVPIPYWMDKNTGIAYTYVVYADVTDPKGETQKGEQEISVGDQSLFILAQIPEKIDKSQLQKIEVITQTLNGENVNSDVNYSVVGLQNSGDYYENTDDNTKWKETGTVLSGKLNTKDKLTLDLKKIPSGMYKIVFKTKDNRGNEVKSESKFILYDGGDKRPPVKTYTWFLPLKTEVAVGEVAKINFGTSVKNSYVLYEVMNGNQILESKWLEMSNEIRSFEIPFLESYGAGITVQFTFIQDEKLFTNQVNITKKVMEKKLTPTVSVFRDKLKPGEKAEWTITVPEVKKDKKTAEVLAAMYDASLDALRPHTWNFNPTFHEWIKPVPQWTAKGFDTDNDYTWIQNGKYVEVSEFQFDDFNWFGLNFGGGNIYMRKQMRIRGVASVKSEDALEANAVVLEMDKAEMEMTSNIKFTPPGVVADEETTDSVVANYTMAKVEVKSNEKPKLRTNFNETAFFYPQLRTDVQGNVKVSFTAPESLTKWHLKMLAHTQDLYFGQNEQFAVTQKELMVQMNLPRFVRRSDKLTLSANVVNLSDVALSPEVKLEIINPENNQIIQLKSTDKKTINLNPKETKSVEWELPELKDFDLVIVKIIAQTAQFSDGEQKYLPVLPDKVLITESQTMTLRAGQKRTFSFDNFIQNFKNTDTKNFTIEYAGNPAWFAVQALPSVAEPTSENAIDYLTAYYANTLAGYIANANPQLKATFDKWKNVDKNALLSNLEKNQELKIMLLEETPWVAEAKDETEQKRRIGLLFDLNRQQYQQDKYLTKLLKLQQTNGGFAWFEGMPENRYITQEILLNLARLNKMTKTDISTNSTLFQSIKRALNFLDLQIAKDFFELKRRDKDYNKHQTINNLQLFYLHTRSEYPQFAVDKSAIDAVNYYTAQSEKYWHDWTLYGKAMMATVAFRNGKTKVANEILTSIRENAMKTDELGMYWAKNTGSWWWYERPIATQTAVMEAFNEIRKANGDIDEMKIWLLKQKQTQRWDTPISTLDAIYALLNYGTDWLSNKGDVEITLGATKLSTQKVEAGTAYLKENIPVETLKPEMGKITVQSKSTSGISWGAAYWQYYVDVDKIKAQGKELNVSKSLFVEKTSKKGKSMLPINQTSLKKGDKVITRLVVTTDRDLEFVALKDLRAACFEPVNQLSGCAWKEGTVYYQTTKDASTQFFFQYLPKGTYVFEYELWVNNTGTYSSGMAEIQCQYAPEFVAHSGGESLVVE
ncbi:Alpha-2-macroglobulin domain protein [uncultured Paludibacter sp.]|uniref:Alpha-2-macroglobulin domain protein n=1 Tax=uncultured Paludibacter sp. TaxID=497635 RepID=A0A653ACK0_9BACT|nr:Alpha-2-macroglobulin domain protein [uncultured Paludibacter sp.]